MHAGNVGENTRDYFILYFYPPSIGAGPPVIIQLSDHNVQMACNMYALRTYFCICEVDIIAQTTQGLCSWEARNSLESPSLH
jgi:hypothetical protein